MDQVERVAVLEKKLRVFSLVLAGTVLITLCAVVFNLTKPAESATNTGTCLPVSKGGTGCFDEEFLNKIYPVGSIYTSTTNTNPSEYLGGTWESFGNGRTLVGMGSNGTNNYTTAESTGGSDNVTLTTAQMPSHTHSLSAWTMVMNTGGVSISGSGAVSSGPIVPQGLRSNQAAQSNDPDNTGGGESHENRQSYITVYFWKRIN